MATRPGDGGARCEAERVAMAFAKINGAVTHYADEGRPDARAIVFINSLGTDFRIWDDVVRPLAWTYRVVRYDKRGHGLSELPAGAALMADYASDLAALLDHLKVSGAVIVGLSIGGLIALELHRLRPDLIAALALCDTAAKIGSDESWRQRIDTVARGGIEAVADRVLELWFSRDYRARRLDELAGWRMMLTRTPKDGYLTACGALMQADLRGECANIRIPTLCVVGDEDGSTPVALVRGLAEAIGQARFVIIDGAGHIPSLEQPDALRALIEGLAKGAAA
jgi:3-oxoadipate enol-lactonase